MTPSLICLLAAVAADPTPTRPILHLSSWEAVVRGQTPYDEPAMPQPLYTAPAQPTYVTPPNGAGMFAPAPVPQDPFLLPPGTAYPQVSPLPMASTMMLFGPYGLQPYRLGWMSTYEFGYISEETADPPAAGDFEVFEFGASWQYATPLGGDWLFLSTPEFSLRTWEGPAFIFDPTLGLPPDVYRIGWNLAVATPSNRDLSYYFGFNPSINSDFERSLTSDAYNWDGVGIMFWRVSPQWTLALGLGYWDRVRDRVIPYTGVIWTPTPAWELQLMFPRSRIRYALGHIGDACHWLYASLEYSVEAYEVSMEPAGFQEKVELEDWRLMFGVESAHARYSKFLEAGWIFARDVRFNNAVPGFDLDSGFHARAGLRF